MMQIRGLGTKRGSAWRLLRLRSLGLAVLVLGLAGCSLDKLLNSDQLPPEVTDPAITKTSDGALAVYRGTLLLFRNAFGGRSPTLSFVAATGVLTDELGPGYQPQFEDQRFFPELPRGLDGYDSPTYRPLQQVRGQAGQAIGLLTDYAPGTQALVGHVYALAGYAEVFLAELFCSGIPLSTLDYNGDYTLKPGSTTAQVLTHAAALFDTALALAGDSSRFVHLAAVGKGRALLGLGQFVAAAAAVAAVPDTFRYQMRYAGDDPAQNFAYVQSGSWTYSVADQEGTNGLNYVTSGDPRTPVTAQGTTRLGTPLYVPTQYNQNGADPIVLASGVEARLIEAEAALQAGDATWLTTLNELRAAGPPPIVIPADTIADTLGVTRCTLENPCGHPPVGDDPVEFGQPAGGFPVPAGYSFVGADTTYPAPPGIGGVGGFCEAHSYYRPCRVGDSMVVYVYVAPAHMGAGLSPLDDPDTPDARVDLLFRERAFWLFLTGHRQGDLRRLLRSPYGRSQSQVYPVGLYPGTSLFYGPDVTVPIPLAERELNPLFTGCASSGA